MELRNKYRYLPDRKLLRSIAAISIPAIITNVTTPLLALCDVAITGHMGNASYIAAIAVGGTMFNMLYWLFGFLRMGTSGTTAQAVGAGDRNSAHAIIRRALLLSLLLSVSLIMLQKPLAALILRIIDAPVNVSDMAGRYFSILIWGAPATLGTFTFTGWLIGMQNTRIPMWVSIFINVFNITASLILVYGSGLKIEGVAIGTLSAQWAGFILTAILSIRRYGMLRMEIRSIFDYRELKRFFRINSDIFLRTVCLVAVTLWFTRTGAGQGTVMLAVNTLLMQLFTIFSYMMDGVAYAGEALCGRYLGERRYDLLGRTINALMLIGLAGAVLFTLAYFAGGTSLLSLLSSERDVIVCSQEYFAWAATIPLAGFMAFVWDGIMIGLTRTRAMLGSMVCGAAIFFTACGLLIPNLGNHGLWLSFILYLMLRGLFLWIYGHRFLSNNLT